MSSDYESKTCPRRRSGNGQEQKVFDALEWLAAMSSHVPDNGEQMVRSLSIMRLSAFVLHTVSD